MKEYKVVYTYADCNEDIEERRQRGYDIFEADSAQDAVDQCRREFYLCEQMDIEEVRVRTYSGWSMTIENWI